MASNEGDVFLRHVRDECYDREQVRDDDTMWVDRGLPRREPPKEESANEERHKGQCEDTDQQRHERKPSANEQRDGEHRRLPWSVSAHGVFSLVQVRRSPQRMTAKEMMPVGAAGYMTS
jgi:hypothetical protein